MAVVWGIVVVLTSVVCWGGQVVSWFAPRRAARLGLADSEGEVDPTFWLDGRGEALWDVCSLWVLPVAGVLLIAGHDGWAYFGLVGGGAYVYFAGRGIVVRSVLRIRQVRIGGVETIRVALVALAVWGVVGLVTIGAAIAALEPA
jgi:hypothetical protein